MRWPWKKGQEFNVIDLDGRIYCEKPEQCPDFHDLIGRQGGDVIAAQRLMNKLNEIEKKIEGTTHEHYHIDSPAALRELEIRKHHRGLQEWCKEHGYVPAEKMVIMGTEIHAGGEFMVGTIEHLEFIKEWHEKGEKKLEGNG